jgi:uncharacterized circularly permuted ATP-grasp superfamily protein
VGRGYTGAEWGGWGPSFAAAPHRFVARARVRPATAPALVDDRVQPRPVDLRFFSAATGRGEATVLAAALSRVGAAVKDTWLLRA